MQSKRTPPEPWPLPVFNPLHIDDFNDHGKPILPSGVEQSNPFAIFSQFFTDKVMEQLVDWTYKYAEQRLKGKEQSPWVRVWRPACKDELYGYLGVLVHTEQLNSKD